LDKYNFTIDLDIQNFRTLLNLDNKLYSLSLFGKFQGYNFLCAYTVFKAMGLPEEHIKYAAENTIWHCRLQLIEKDPLVIVDATHNAAGARSLYDSLVGVYKQNEVVVITSILKDKDIISMLNYLNKLSDSIIYTTIDNNPRGMRANDLAKIGSGIFQHELCIDNPLSALNIAKQMDKKVILITGSLYLLNYFVKIN
jgi:dihydrofolate synthase/folylpolyglutamate synthase